MNPSTHLTQISSQLTIAPAGNRTRVCTVAGSNFFNLEDKIGFDGIDNVMIMKAETKENKNTIGGMKW
ncbi:hypothetical protein MTR_3g072890 [Medicago truncatula]|uniref:Uncharacterized protein n=1 Tax=Medicago truncatula TaxID=3880 RepID=G7J3K5_MEDTR|nr:hypothetical protein MTR_3g072890 [Medicago truncatula]